MPCSAQSTPGRLPPSIARSRACRDSRTHAAHRESDAHRVIRDALHQRSGAAGPLTLVISLLRARLIVRVIEVLAVDRTVVFSGDAEFWRGGEMNPHSGPLNARRKEEMMICSSTSQPVLGQRAHYWPKVTLSLCVNATTIGTDETGQLP